MYSKQRGSIIAFTLIVLSFILTSGLAVITVASLERKSSLVTQKSVTAFQAADGGAERILKRIYIENSPSTMTTPKDGSMVDTTLDDVAQNLTGVLAGATCDTALDAIVATSDSTPAYTFQATLLDGSGTPVDCADPTWRDKVVRMKVNGFYRQTVRVIEVGIKPRPKCNTTVDDADGNTYDVIEIAGMCWTKQNMRVGTRINTSITPSNNGIIEYYCYDDDPLNCTADHPNYPDGGLYTWNEAMQYSTTEGARGICPAGWHIPTDEEWYFLEDFVDESIIIPSESGYPGDALDVGYRGTDGAKKLMTGGSSGFEGNFTGVYVNSTGFMSRDAANTWWTSRGSGTINNNVRYAHASGVNKDKMIRSYTIAPGTGSVRCILDE